MQARSGMESAHERTTERSLSGYTAMTNLTQGQAVSIEVNATDLPGHKTTKSQARP
jgi:hypothetical protein